jgi:NAD(P)-dependent dehydrogenase (short-subunit alcohol dehydrogenase family)
LDHRVPGQDFPSKAAVARAAPEVRVALAGGRLWGLVNNAGIGVPGPLLETSADDFRQQLEVNLVAPMVVIKAFARGPSYSHLERGSAKRLRFV